METGKLFLFNSLSITANQSVNNLVPFRVVGFTPLYKLIDKLTDYKLG